MSNFIEVPLYLKENDPEVDYEALGIEEDAPVGYYKSILNTDSIQRINTTEHPEAESVIWTRDGLCYYTSVSYDKLKNMIPNVR